MYAHVIDVGTKTNENVSDRGGGGGSNQSMFTAPKLTARK